MDLYNIPGDTGKDWRLNKFIEYQHEVPSIHYRVLGEYIKQNSINMPLAVFMCWCMSCTYNEVTCILLPKIIHLKDIKKSNCHEYLQNFWKEYKPKLLFGSSRKYAKNMDWFPILMEEFFVLTKKQPYKWLKSFPSGEQGYQEIFAELSQLKFVGRFATELFMESVLYLNDYFETSFIEPCHLDWKHCSNLTSGILNIFYQDEEADIFDKTGKILVSEEFLTKKLSYIQKRIQEIYPEQAFDGVNLFVGKICSFRNLFKKTRYGGFHHDRELGVLREYEQLFPEYQNLWDEIFDLRLKMFKPKYLGEIGGWNGIRPERKKLFITKGLTGVEEELYE